MTLFYRCIRAIAFPASVIFPVRGVNKKGIPQGPVLLIINHRIWYDAVAVAITATRQVHYMTKSDNYKNKIAAWFFNKCGVFSVHRDTADLTAIRHGIKILKEGKILAVFPEGTRNRSGEKLQRFHEGAAMFALKTDCQVIPIYLHPFRLFRFSRAVVGEPLDLSGWKGQVGRESLAGVTQLFYDTLDRLASV